jgi:hypothetical protein
VTALEIESLVRWVNEAYGLGLSCAIRCRQHVEKRGKWWAVVDVGGRELTLWWSRETVGGELVADIYAQLAAIVLGRRVRQNTDIVGRFGASV